MAWLLFARRRLSSVCHGCIVAERQVVVGRQEYHQIWRWRLPIGCQ